MADEFLTDQILTWETLRILRNNLKIWPQLYNGFENEFAKGGHKIGDTLMVRKPQRFIAGSGPNYDPQPLSDTQTPVVVNQYSKVHFEFSSTEKALSLDNFSQRYLYKAAVALANQLDFMAAQFLALNSFNTVGTPGTTPTGATAFNTYLQAPAKLRKFGFIQDGLSSLVLNSTATVEIVDSLKGLFNPQATIGRQFKTGMMGTDSAGMDWYEDENIYTLTTGIYATAGHLDGVQTAAGGNNATMNLATNGWTSADALNAGDVFTIAGVHSVNPQNRTSTGQLQQFVVLQDATADGAGNMPLVIAPALTPDGQYQNVDVAPASNAAITPYQDTSGHASAAISTKQLLCFHQDAAAVLSVPLDVPKNVDMGYQDTDKETGITMRFTRTWDPVHDVWPCRFDILWGISPLYREGCVRIASGA